MSRALKPCGTRAAFARHLRNDERPCEPCRVARNAASADFQRKTGGGRARQRAMTALKARNLPLFKRLRAAAEAEEPGSDQKARQRAYQAALRELARQLPEEYGRLFEIEMADERAKAAEV